MTATQRTSEEMRLLQVNGEIAYLWATNEAVVQAARAFLKHRDKLIIELGDTELGSTLDKALRDALAEADSVMERIKTPPLARLIAAAPALLDACKAQHKAIDLLFAMLIARDENFYPSESGRPWDAIVQGNAAIAKGEGKEV